MPGISAIDEQPPVLELFGKDLRGRVPPTYLAFCCPHSVKNR